MSSGSILRKRFNDYMVLRGLSQNTQESYIQAVSGLALYYNQSTARLSNDQIQTYLLYIIKDRCLAWSSCNVAFAGIRCFYTQILKWDETRFHIPPRSRQKKRPRILSIQEVERLLSVVKNPKHRALLMTVYGAGLRVSEVVRLKPCHIESDRMLIRVELAKGRVDRYTILQERLLKELRIYWELYRPGREWLFHQLKLDQRLDETANNISQLQQPREYITKPVIKQVLLVAVVFIRFAMPLPLICWRTGKTSTPFSGGWAISP